MMAPDMGPAQKTQWCSHLAAQAQAGQHLELQPSACEAGSPQLLRLE